MHPITESRKDLFIVLKQINEDYAGLILTCPIGYKYKKAMDTRTFRLV
jgi:hypothetical protein